MTLTLDRPKAPARTRIAKVLLRSWRQGDAAQVLAVALVDGSYAVQVNGALTGDRYADRQAAMLAASKVAWG